MFPYFVAGNQTYPMYALIGLAALFIASGTVYSRARNIDFTYFDLLIGIVFLGVGLIVGGMFLYSIVQIPFLWENRAQLTVFSFFRTALGGMVFYGGLVGALASIPLYAKVIKRDIPTIVILLTPAFPLAHGIMRIGCFMAGCCYGIEHEALGITFARSLVAPNGVSLLPVQLYETIANIVIFVVLWMYTKKHRTPLKVLCLYGTLYATARFMLEFLRGDTLRGFIFTLSTSQFISVLVITSCVIALFWQIMKPKQSEA